MRLRIAALAALCMLLTSCGSGSPRAGSASAGAVTPIPTPVSTLAPTPAATAVVMTHTEFVHALDASCSKNKPQEKKLSARFESAMERGSLVEAGGLYGVALKAVAAHTRRASALVPPAQDRSAFRRYLAAQRRIQGLGRRIVRALREQDSAQVARLAEVFQGERDRRLKAAIDLGADSCGS